MNRVRRQEPKKPSTAYLSRTRDKTSSSNFVRAWSSQKRMTDRVKKKRSNPGNLFKPSSSRRNKPKKPPIVAVPLPPPPPTPEPNRPVRASSLSDRHESTCPKCGACTASKVHELGFWLNLSQNVKHCSARPRSSDGGGTGFCGWSWIDSKPDAYCADCYTFYRVHINRYGTCGYWCVNCETFLTKASEVMATPTAKLSINRYNRPTYASKDGCTVSFNRSASRRNSKSSTVESVRVSSKLLLKCADA